MNDERRKGSAAPPLTHSAWVDLHRVSALLNALQCGAMLVDRAGGIAHANNQLCRMMQRSRDDVIGRSLFDWYPSGEGRRVIQDALDHFAEPREQEFYLPRPDGTRLPVIVSARHLDAEPNGTDFRIVTVIDISPQKHAEQELQQRYADITSLSDTVLEQALELKHYTHELENRVQQRTRELHTANMEAIFMLAVASEAKDQDTGAHVRRIAHTTRLLAAELNLSTEVVARISHSSILHDVGKIHVPDHILQKPGALTADEWEIMKQHTVFGERILSQEPFFDVARIIARHHHENWDGSGYPDGLSEENIPLAARIVRVPDVFDALTTARPYKPAWSPQHSADTIERGSGSSFDPRIVKAFLRLFHDGRLSATP